MGESKMRYKTKEERLEYLTEKAIDFYKKYMECFNAIAELDENEADILLEWINTQL